ncbi:hypothetical protein GA0115255_106856 [Streptomyces sp. Ncost-T6T-2b]|nr:hypothetical protein GA0115255_106856 [Streptomyces sp. Ncost-T6T-2b]
MISRRKCLYAVSPEKSYVFVSCRLAKDSPLRVSRSVHSLPSAEPLSVQSFGSRSAWSLAEVRAYVTTLTGSSRSNSTQPVFANVSHLEAGSTSTRFSLTSPPAVFSALARTSVTRSVTLPGMPEEKPPSTPEDRFLPSGPSSTVLRQSGCFSSASKEVVNVRSPEGLRSGEAGCAVATAGAITTRARDAARAAAVGVRLRRGAGRGTA